MTDRLTREEQLAEARLISEDKPTANEFKALDSLGVRYYAGDHLEEWYDVEEQRSRVREWKQRAEADAALRADLAEAESDAYAQTSGYLMNKDRETCHDHQTCGVCGAEMEIWGDALRKTEADLATVTRERDEARQIAHEEGLIANALREKLALYK